MTDRDSRLDSFYPWQSSEALDPQAMQAELKVSVQQKLAEAQRVQQAFFDAHTADLINAAAELARCFADGGKLFTMGNGGSACDAAHVAVEFGHPVTAGRPALPAINLCADTAMLTALGNDLGYADTFARQLRAHATKNDALIGLSTSGNSENLLRGFAVAAELGMTTIALLGAGGGAVASAGQVQHLLIVPSDSVHRAQETHLCIYHQLWELVHAQLAAGWA